MYVSWYADVPSGAVITLIGTALFAVAWLVSDATRRRAIAAIDSTRSRLTAPARR